MKPLKENLLIKDATIHKVQFDTEGFFKLDEMSFYLKEDLSEVSLFTYQCSLMASKNL
jgi:hypothetical protein